MARNVSKLLILLPVLLAVYGLAGCSYVNDGEPTVDGDLEADAEHDGDLDFEWDEDGDLDLEPELEGEGEEEIEFELEEEIEFVNPPFGTAITGRYIYGAEAESRSGQLYQNTLAEHFRWAVTENALKMGHIHPSEGEWNFEVMDALLEWCDSMDIGLKGHTLMWDFEIHLPGWILAMDTAVQRRAAVRNHIFTIGTRYAGRLPYIDVLNEPLHAPGWEDVLDYGDAELLVQLFGWTHEIMPEAKLLVNEYDIIANLPLRRQYIDLIQRALADGAAIDGVGIQGHFTTRMMEPVQLAAVIEEVHAATGLPVQISEFDIAAPEDPDEPFEGFSSWWWYQAWAYRAAFEAFENSDGFELAFMWGFTDLSHWQYGAGIWDASFNEKPVTATMRPLLLPDDPRQPTVHCEAPPLLESGDMFQLSCELEPGVMADGLPPLHYGWTILDGPALVLDGAAGLTPSFTAPEVSGLESWLLQLQAQGDSQAKDDPGPKPEFVRVRVVPSGVPVVPVALEAEDMTIKTSGEPVAQGWNIYTTGSYIADYIRVEQAGEYTVKLRLSGAPALGEWPIATLWLDGLAVWSGTIDSETYYDTLVPLQIGEGVHEIGVRFENDAWEEDSDFDRNLYVDRVEIY